MLRERKLAALRRALPGGHVKGDEYVAYCPRHASSPGRSSGQLSANLVTDEFHCWSCGWGNKSSLAPLIRAGGNREDLELYLDGRSAVSAKKPQRTYSRPVLPDEFRSLSSPPETLQAVRAMGYLSRRGVGPDDILRYKIGYCEGGEYGGRIVFPSFDERGELNFFIGRLPYEPRASQLRYKHGDFDKDVVFNDYLIDWNEPVVLVEGHFDMVKAGDNAIPLQGSDLREMSRLFRKIASRGIDVYFAMDADAFTKQLRIIGRFLAYGIKCWYVDMGKYGDPGQMKKECFQEHRVHARPVSSDFDLIRMRIGG